MTQGSKCPAWLTEALTILSGIRQDVRETKFGGLQCDSLEAVLRSAADLQQEAEELQRCELLIRANSLIKAAECLGFVVTIEQVPLQPLAMGNYASVAHVRKARHA